MRSAWISCVELCGIVAVGVSMFLVGCSRGGSDGSRPETASAVGRSVIGNEIARSASDSGASEQPKTLTAPAASMTELDSVEPAQSNFATSDLATSDLIAEEKPVPSEIRIPAEPVVATRPMPLVEAPPAASANRLMARAEAPVITDPNADPSQFPGGIVPASPNAQPLPGGPRLLVPEREFRAEGRPRALRVHYDDLDLLRVLNMGDPLPEDVVEQFPDWLTNLDGKTIRLRGFMYPSYQQELSAFILTRDTGACCFGPNPKVYYLVGVKLKDGETVRYIGDRPFDVVGTFHITPVYNDGQWYQLYKITDATVVQ